MVICVWSGNPSLCLLNSNVIPTHCWWHSHLHLTSSSLHLISSRFQLLTEKPLPPHLISVSLQLPLTSYLSASSSPLTSPSPSPYTASTRTQLAERGFSGWRENATPLTSEFTITCKGACVCVCVWGGFMYANTEKHPHSQVRHSLPVYKLHCTARKGGLM